MANVSVLLHLGDRKKVVAVPSNCANHYAFLSETVVEWTGERVQYFERFDSDWEEWIEVEKKDFQASNKDRIKAVISIPDESSEVTNCNVGKPQEENSKVLAEYSDVRVVCQFSSTKAVSPKCIQIKLVIELLYWLEYIFLKCIAVYKGHVLIRILCMHFSSCQFRNFVILLTMTSKKKHFCIPD